MFYNKYLKITLFIMFLFLCQKLLLGYVSFLGSFNFILKIFCGGIVVFYLRDKFNLYYFRALYVLSAISLTCFVIINLFKVSFPYISLGEDVKSYVIYSTSWYLNKNQGMYWEPGAFAGILTLCLALNFSNLHYLWLEHRFKLVVIFITLLTTQSTTGYIVGFIILLFYFINIKNKFIAFMFLPAVITGAMYIYYNFDFLNEKILVQQQQAKEQNIGDFSNTRFGSLIFDWHYIEKHPFIGNGLHESTRYADHQFLFYGTTTDVIGSGNGFSHYLASMGVFFIIGYFYLLYKSTPNGAYFFTILLLLVIFLNLQGEQWFNYPLYLGLPFMNSSIDRHFQPKVIAPKKVTQK